MHLAAPNRAATPSPAGGLDPYLRLNDVERATGLKRSTIYALVKAKKFPASVRITARCVAWRSSQVAKWMEERESVAPSSTPAGGTDAGAGT